MTSQAMQRLPKLTQSKIELERQSMDDPGTKLDIAKLSPEVEKLQESLLSKIIGQDRAIRQIIKAYIPTTVNMHRENRPMGVFLFLGPTGVGKSETVKQFAKTLLGKRDAVTKIDCNEYQQDHEVAKLIGAPPGYVGFNVPPRLAQEQIDQYQTQDVKINIILFDEIEKADPRLFDAILSILGDGMLVLGNGQKADFSRSFIFLTSNLGSAEVKKLIQGEGIGYKQKEEMKKETIDEQIYRTAKSAAEKKFRPEFLNRIDRTIVFRPLDEASIRKILTVELRELQYRIWHSPYRGFKLGEGKSIPPRFTIVFKLTDAATNFIIKEGFSDLYGARELNRVIDRYIAFPLAALISSKQVQHGDRLKVDHVEGEKDLTFTKDGVLTT